MMPEMGFFAHRLAILNVGATERSFSHHFPIELPTQPAGSVYAFQIRPRQTVMNDLGMTLQRASDQACVMNCGSPVIPVVAGHS